MGWICPRCGSENLYSDRTCAACLKATSKVWRLYQRFRQAYLKARPYEAVQARRSAPLSGVQRMCRKFLRLNPVLVAVCMLCVAFDVLPSLDGDGWMQRRERIEAQMTRAASIITGTMRDNAAQLMEEMDVRMNGMDAAGDMLADVTKRLEAGREHAEKTARKIGGIEPDTTLLLQRFEAVRQRSTSMNAAFRHFVQRAEYAADVVHEAIPFF